MGESIASNCFLPLQGTSKSIVFINFVMRGLYTIHIKEHVSWLVLKNQTLCIRTICKRIAYYSSVVPPLFNRREQVTNDFLSFLIQFRLHLAVAYSCVLYWYLLLTASHSLLPCAVGFSLCVAIASPVPPRQPVSCILSQSSCLLRAGQVLLFHCPSCAVLRVLLACVSTGCCIIKRIRWPFGGTSTVQNSVTYPRIIVATAFAVCTLFQ